MIYRKFTLIFYIHINYQTKLFCKTDLVLLIKTLIFFKTDTKTLVKAPCRKGYSKFVNSFLCSTFIDK